MSAGILCVITDRQRQTKGLGREACHAVLSVNLGAYGHIFTCSTLWQGLVHGRFARVNALGGDGHILPGEGKICLLASSFLVQAIDKGQEFRHHDKELGGYFRVKIES